MEDKLINLFTVATVLASGCNSCVPVYHYDQTKSPKIERRVEINSLEQLVESAHCLKSERTYEDGEGNSFQGAALGSSFVYRESGGYYYLLTNQHVVGALEEERGGVDFTRKEALVKIIDSKYDKDPEDDIPLEVVFESEELDLAILRTRTKLQILDEDYFGDSSTLNYGDRVHLIGYPLGMFLVVTEGIVANPGNYPFEFDLEDEKNGIVAPFSSRKVLDLTINPGNSGGPFFLEKEGRFYWMGIASAYYIHSAGGPFYQENSGLAIATESNLIKAIADYVIVNADEFVEERIEK